MAVLSYIKGNCERSVEKAKLPSSNDGCASWCHKSRCQKGSRIESFSKTKQLFPVEAMLNNQQMIVHLILLFPQKTDETDVMMDVLVNQTSVVVYTKRTSCKVCILHISSKDPLCGKKLVKMPLICGAIIAFIVEQSLVNLWCCLCLDCGAIFG